MRVIPRRLAIGILLGLATVAFGSLSGCYVLKQGVGQARLLFQRQSIAAILADPNAAPELKAKLQLIQAAKAYAETTIGLKASRNYQDFVQLDRDAVTYVVAASPPDRLEAKTWWFPIIGDVPYKGYFERADAVAEQDTLKTEGFDTILRGVPAFSTLGWLPDPVYSPFLAYERSTLANVVIHELTHVTLFLAGQASFNEGFATFVGNQGARDFLGETFGKQSPEYKEAVAAVADNAMFTDFVSEISRKLETLYASDLSREAKLAERLHVFAWAKARFTSEYQPRMNSHQFRHFPQSAFNNAALVSYRTYYHRLDRFEMAHRKLGGDLAHTVSYFKETVARDPHPEAFLDNFLKP